VHDRFVGGPAGHLPGRVGARHFHLPVHPVLPATLPSPAQPHNRGGGNASPLPNPSDLARTGGAGTPHQGPAGPLGDPPTKRSWSQAAPCSHLNMGLRYDKMYLPRQQPAGPIVGGCAKQRTGRCGYPIHCRVASWRSGTSKTKERFCYPLRGALWPARLPASREKEARMSKLELEGGGWRVEGSAGQAWPMLAPGMPRTFSRHAAYFLKTCRILSQSMRHAFSKHAACFLQACRILSQDMPHGFSRHAAYFLKICRMVSPGMPHGFSRHAPHWVRARPMLAPIAAGPWKGRGHST